MDLVAILRTSGGMWVRDLTVRLMSGFERRSSVVVPLGVFCLMFYLACFLAMSDGFVFETPDETANFLAAQALGEGDKPVIQNELTAIDHYDLIHPRGFVTFHGQASPFNYLGLSVVHGIIWKLSGPYGALAVAALLSSLAVVALGMAGRRLFPTAGMWSYVLVMAMAPIPYWLSRPFMNLAPALAMICFGTLFFCLFYRSKKYVHFLVGSLFFGLATVMRYDLGVVLLMAALLAGGVTLARHKGIGRAVKLTSIAITFTAVIPGLVATGLNWWVFGNPLQFGYLLFTERMGGGGFAPFSGLGLFGVIISAVIPIAPDINTALQGVGAYFGRMTPIPTLLALLGSYWALRSKELKWYTLAGFSMLGGYLLISRASPDLWGSNDPGANIGYSLIRYWTPVSILVYLVGIRALAGKSFLLKGVLLVGLVWSVWATMWGYPSSLANLAAGLRNESNDVASVIRPTEESAVIYTAMDDKLVVPFRMVAAWWEAPEASWFDGSRVANSMAEIRDAGWPVYVLFRNSIAGAEQKAALHTELPQRGFYLEQTWDARLFRVTSFEDGLMALLSRYGCWGPVSDGGNSGKIEINDAQLACFFGKRPDILELYRSGGWDISQGNYRSILEDWLAWTRELGVSGKVDWRTARLKMPALKEMLHQFGCQETDAKAPYLSPFDLTDAELTCFFGKRREILELYASNGWDIAQGNYRYILEDWLAWTQELESTTSWEENGQR